MQKTNTITSIASPSTSVRRDWLTRLGSGLGAIACSTLLHKHASGAWYSQEGKQGPEGKQGSEGKLGLHHAPKAKHVIEIFCPGGLSHVDTWDYKPELERLHGTPFDAELGKQTFAGVAGTHAKSFWPFQQRGQSGLWISDLFPQLSRCADNLAFIHSMQSKSCLLYASDAADDQSTV
jgi:hypothetical protein